MAVVMVAMKADHLDTLMAGLKVELMANWSVDMKVDEKVVEMAALLVAMMVV